MRLNLARGHPPRIHRQNFVIEPIEACLVLRHNLRLEAPVAVPWRLQRDFAELTFHRFRAGPIARVPTVVSSRIVLLVAQVVRQFRVHGSLDQRLGELLQQPRLADQIFGFFVVLDQLV